MMIMLEGAVAQARREVEAVRQALQCIPLHSRRDWRINDLARWWDQASLYDPRLNVDSLHISWEQVKRECTDLIGDAALD